jgi:hypothetical protein
VKIARTYATEAAGGVATTAVWVLLGSSSEVTVVDFEVPRMLKRDVLSNIIEQNLSGGVQPGDQRFSGGCVLVIGGRESEKGDPQDNVERFLWLVYGKRSNLNRLQPVPLQRSPQTLAVHAVRLL